MSDPDPPIPRVIDLIAHLQNHDPVAPIQVWQRSTDSIWKPIKVVQVTPDFCREQGVQDPRPEESGPYPVVVFVE